MKNPDLHDFKWGWDGQSRDEMLRKMEPGVGWSKPPNESVCGHGSTKSATIHARDALEQITERYDIGTVADVGAGDLSWIQLVSWPLVTYHAYDLIPRHEDVIEFDCTADPLPQAYDLILCRFVLNHLSARRAQHAMRLFRCSGSRYLAMTVYPKMVAYWEQFDIMPPADSLLAEYPETHSATLNVYDLERLKYDPDPR